jgi:hypothetical protein
MPSERELTINRVVNAPRKLMFKVWTEPEHFDDVPLSCFRVDGIAEFAPIRLV